jgi:hypothetical protein
MRSKRSSEAGSQSAHTGLGFNEFRPIRQQDLVWRSMTVGIAGHFLIAVHSISSPK